MSSRSIARPISAIIFFKPFSSISIKPSITLTSSGTALLSFRVSGLSIDARLDSTGLIQYSAAASTSSSETSPSRTITFAVRTVGFSPPVII